MAKIPSSAEMLSIVLTGQVNGKFSAKNIRKRQIGWTLSYNPYCADTDCDETAIILGEREAYLILYGNHANALDGATRDFAVAYWKSHPNLHGATSDQIEED